jgi:hypothetical protein
MNGLAFLVPSGLIADFYGPELGRLCDRNLFTLSGLANFYVYTDGSTYRVSLSPDQRDDETRVSIYTDSGFSAGDGLAVPYSVLDEMGDVRKKILNRKLRRARVSVEWAFGKLQQLFASLQMELLWKLFLSPIHADFRVLTLLTNAKVILDRRTQVSDYFEAGEHLIPTMDEYFVSK